MVDGFRYSVNGDGSGDGAVFRQNDGQAMTLNAKGNSMLNFVKSAFRGFFGVILWIILIFCTIAGGVIGFGIGRGDAMNSMGGAILGGLVGLLGGLFTNIVGGGFIAIILNIDENLEYLANKTKNTSSSGYLGNISSLGRIQENKKCKQCGKSVDSGYTACPHCGASNFE
jgi:hypothetical protein